MQVLSAAETFWLLLAALCALPLALAICWQLPRQVSLGIVALLFLFSSSTWGQIDADNTLYARGTGLFYFSLINILLWVAAAAAASRRLITAQRMPARSPFAGFFFAFAFMMMAHLTVGLMAGQDGLVILGYSGLINVLNMLVFCHLLTSTVSGEQGQRNLLQLMLGLAALRALFGMARYVFWGGDSANPYRNFENLDIRIFYFDIADNFVAALAAFCIAWLLLMPNIRLAMWKRLLLFALLALEIAAVALSFRRSSLIGLALMFLVLLWQLPWRRRLQCMGLGALALVATAMVFMRQRLQFNSGNGGFLDALLYDVGPARTTDVSRFYELEAAARSLDGNWLFGLGSWGRFYGNEEILDYHFGKFDFVHSGFGHLILKSGFAGLLLFLALLASFVVHVLRIRPRLVGNGALLADAGLAALLFWIPTLLVGTPVIEFRTMLLIGLGLALPYLAQSRLKQRAHSSAHAYVAA